MGTGVGVAGAATGVSVAAGRVSTAATGCAVDGVSTVAADGVCAGAIASIDGSAGALPPHREQNTITSAMTTMADAISSAIPIRLCRLFLYLFCITFP